jgi:hypothetical protein
VTGFAYNVAPFLALFGFCAALAWFVIGHRA